MFFTTFIRDYLESLSVFQLNFSNVQSITTLFQVTGNFLLCTSKIIFIYIFTFQWVRDFFYLPLFLPNIVNQIIQEKYVINDELNLLTISPITQVTQNIVLVGFLNSFFLSLPITIPTILLLRRLLVENKQAWGSALLGTIVGQVSLLASVLFGLRFLVIPWVKWEPFPSILGLILTLSVAHQFIEEQRVVQPSKKLIVQYFFLSFFLSWTEQTILFPSFSSFGSIQTLLDLNEKTLHSQTWGYLIGFTLGSFLFLSLFSWVAFQIKKLLERKIALPKIENRLNFIFTVAIIGFSIATFPYYTFDYLATAPLGFLPNDKALKPVLNQCEKLVENPESQLLTQENDKRIREFASFQESDRSETNPLEELLYSGETKTITKLARNDTIVEKNLSGFTQNFLQKFLSFPIQLTKPEITQKENIVWEMETDFDDNKFQNTKFENKDLLIPAEKQKENEEIFEIFKVLLGSYSFYDLNTDRNVLDSNIKDRSFKERYYKNPLYKYLLTADINNFLSGQPKEYFLTSEEKEQLQTTRIALFSYANTLRKYHQMPDFEEFYTFLNGVKSYSNQVYNHQFKGTWVIVRRLFQLDPDSIESTNFLSYDQPLFRSKKTKFQHEELKQFNENEENVRLKLINPVPFYAGWDNETKKFVLTTRFLDLKNANTRFIKNNSEESEKIFFTSWPIFPSEETKKRKIDYSGLTYTGLEENLINNLKENLGIEQLDSKLLKTLPQNVSRIGQTNLPESIILPPEVGGWFWPGAPITFLK